MILFFLILFLGNFTKLSLYQETLQVQITSVHQKSVFTSGLSFHLTQCLLKYSFDVQLAKQNFTVNQFRISPIKNPGLFQFWIQVRYSGRPERKKNTIQNATRNTMNGLQLCKKNTCTLSLLNTCTDIRMKFLSFATSYITFGKTGVFSRVGRLSELDMMLEKNETYISTVAMDMSDEGAQIPRQFRIKDGRIEKKTSSQWQTGFNFTIDVVRIVTGGPDRGGPVVKLQSPLFPGHEL